MIKLLPWVALGGAVGAMGRHGVDALLPAGAGFPWGTLLINVVGSLLLALMPLSRVVRSRAWGPDIRIVAALTMAWPGVSATRK